MPVAVVTGSSTGIGKATAVELASHGYDILLHAHASISGLLATARLLQSQSPCRVRVVTADIRNARSCEALVESAFAWQGSVAAWVNNAGADILTGSTQQKPFHVRLEALLATDVVGTITLSRLVAERFSRQTPTSVGNLPSVINIGWDQAELGMEGDAGQLFCPAKAAVMAFTRSLAMSLAGLARVNCVAPGWIQTDWGAEAPENWNRRATQESLLNRWGAPEDVAKTIAWLCDREQSNFVNGQVVNVNGGRRFFPIQDSNC